MFQRPTGLRSLLFPCLAAALAYAAWRSYGWPGLLLALSMITFWLLLHFTKLMRLLRTAAARPMGHVRDAQALHRHLKRGLPMSQVVQLTLSLGQRRSEVGQEPEVFEWGDEAGHLVTCTFRHGRLARFELHLATPPPPADRPDSGEAPPGA